MRNLLLTAMLTASAASALPARGAEPQHGETWSMPHMHEQRYGMVMADRLEYGDSDEAETLLWDLQAWYGGDFHKIWFESEGHGETGDSPDTELQLRYDRTFSPFWSWQAGLRQDVHPDGEPDTTYAAFGVQGLAPQWFETDLSLFVSDDGDISLRGEIEYDVRLTQRLILEPRLEADVSAGDVPELGLGSGLTETAFGLRLRYEVMRELAPYVGVRRQRLHGDTRAFARAAGEPTSSTALVVGVRAWF